MKTHYAEESDNVISSNDTADEHCWREHKLRKTELFSDLAILATVLICLATAGFFWNALPSPPERTAAAAQQALPVYFDRGKVRLPRQSEVDDDR